MKSLKKCLILVIAILFTAITVNAECPCDWETPQTMQLTSPITRAITNALGMNFIAKQAAKT